MSKILITGTSKGIGYDAALCLARNGHEVVATMRNPNNSDLSEIASKESLNIDIQALDVDDIDSVKEVFDKVGAIDVLINNAGILSYNILEDESIERFMEVVNTNLFGVVRCCKAVIPRMRAAQSGCIINIGSVAGKVTIPCSSAYSSSKHAIEAFSEVLAQEMLPFGVRVHLVQPGIIDTPMATTEFPAPKKDSLYPQGKRVSALFAAASQVDAPASLVSDKLKYLIEVGDERLRHPVGPDSLVFLGYRASVDDERLISTWGAASDEEFLRKSSQDMMMDLTPFME